MYLLDTNIVSDFVGDPRGNAGRKIIHLGDAAVATTVIVAGELRFGAMKRASKRLTEQVEEALDLLTILPIKSDVSIYYGRLRADLERRSMPISANDMWIAAHALSIGATLVTGNVREFERVGGLAIENWLLST